MCWHTHTFKCSTLNHNFQLFKSIPFFLKHLRPKCVDWVNWPVTSLAHEGDTKASKIVTVLHFFCKDVRWIAFATNVRDIMLPSLTHSLTAFSWCSMWQMPLVVILWHHLMQALLLLYTGVATSVSIMGLPREKRWAIIFLTFMVRREPALVAQILALQELSDVLFCCSVFQVIGPPDLNKIVPLILLNLNRGS